MVNEAARSAWSFRTWHSPRGVVTLLADLDEAADVIEAFETYEEVAPGVKGPKATRRFSVHGSVRTGNYAYPHELVVTEEVVGDPIDARLSILRVKEIEMYCPPGTTRKD